MDTGDRVALRTDPSWTGTVTSVRGHAVCVKGDDGWSGTLAVETLGPLEDKAWPPAGMEHK